MNTSPGTSPLVGALVLLCISLLVALIIAARRAESLKAALSEELNRQKSLSSTYGRITEQWFPLMDAYPYDHQNFRFLGSPIDGVQFEEDRIVFIEFKANGSRLSFNQQRIQRLIEEGHVYWEAFHFVDEPEPAAPPTPPSKWRLPRF